eukprot:1161047-Pelagomonas_calceolata.AAC.59
MEACAQQPHPQANWDSSIHQTSYASQIMVAPRELRGMEVVQRKNGGAELCLRTHQTSCVPAVHRRSSTAQRWWSRTLPEHSPNFLRSSSAAWK